MYKRFFLFGLVGFIGFLVDCAILYLLKEWLGMYIARALSFISAVFVTWSLNRSITFKHRISGQSQLKEFFTYFLYMISGGLINYAVYVVLISTNQLIYELPVIAVAIGSIAGMFTNYMLSAYLFSHKKN